MGLRLKLFLPLAALAILLTVYVVGIWVPQLRDSALSQHAQLQRAHLETLAAGLVVPLRELHWSEVHALLDAASKRNPHWRNIRLESSGHNLLYPLTTPPDQLLTPNDVSSQVPLRYRDAELGMLSATVNMAPLFESEQRRLVVLQATLLIVLVSTLLAIAWSLERIVRRPLAQLVSAADDLANNQFDTPLPAAAADEMGTLVKVFSAMRRTVAQHRVATTRFAIELQAQKRAFDEHNVVVVCDPDGHIRTVNEKFSRLCGRTFDDLLTTDFRSLVCDDGQGTPFAAMLQTLRVGSVWQGELTLRTQDGGALTLDATAVPYMDDQQALLRFIFVAMDISARRAAEQQLVATEARLRHLIVSSSSVIYTMVPSGDARMTYVSENLPDLLGYQPAELYANLNFWHDHIHPEDRPRVFMELPTLFVHGNLALEYRFLDGHGNYRWILDQTRLIRSVTGEPIEVVGSLTDIRQQKQAEQTLQEREERLRTLFNNAFDAIFVVDENGHIETANPAAVHMFGYTIEQLTGSSVEMLMPHLAPERHSTYIRNYIETKSGKSRMANRELSAKRQDGSEFPVEVAITRMDLKGGARVVGTIRDITERKRTEQVIIAYRDHLEQLVQERTGELERTRDKALMAEKAMATFLANMSHELRTPLHGILSFASFGLKKLDRVGPEKLKEYFSEIRDSGQHLLDLVNNLLDLTKLQSGKMGYEYRPVELRGIVADVMKELEAYLDQCGMQVQLHCSAADTRLTADRGKLAQVVRNLLSNAIKFGGTTAPIEVGIEGNAEQLVLSVSDRGVGVPENELEIIFSPFVQSSKTASNAGGTGLGLPICREIIEQGHGGKVIARNREGGGAYFTAVIPRSPVQANKVSPPADYAESTL